MELKGTRKKKGKKIDDPDFMVSPHMASGRARMLIAPQPTLHPVVKKDVPKVMQAIRQTQSRKVLLKLLTRLRVQVSGFALATVRMLMPSSQITDDPRPLNQIMRLRGFTVMKNIMDDYAKDSEMITLVCDFPKIGLDSVDPP